MATKVKIATKTEVISAVADGCGLDKKAVGAVLDSLVEVAVCELNTSGGFKLHNLVQLKKVVKPALPERTGRNPATGEPMQLKAKPARTVVKALPLKHVKDAVTG